MSGFPQSLRSFFQLWGSQELLLPKTTFEHDLSTHSMTPTATHNTKDSNDRGDCWPSRVLWMSTERAGIERRLTLGIRACPLVLAIGLIFLVAPKVGAQQVGNRLLLTTRGPTGPVRALRFSPDSTRLYSGGLDKQVHVWKIDSTKQNVTASHTQYLRWEVGRADRGCIYSMDISSGGRLFFAGYSARGNGYIAGYDPGDRMLIQSLPRSPGTLKETDVRHRQPVIGLSFSPSGNRLVSTSRDGEMLLWQKGQPVTRVQSAHPRLRTDHQAATFLGEDQVACPIPLNPNNAEMGWGLRVTNIKTNTNQTLRVPHFGGVTAIARDSHQQGRWASADNYGALYIWSGIPEARPQKIDLWQAGLAEVRDINFLSGNQLLISTGADVPLPGSKDMRPRPARLVLLDLSRLPIGGATWSRPDIGKQIRLGDSMQDYPCTVSRDSKLAATYAGARNEIWIFRLRDDNGNAIQRPFAPENRTILRRATTEFASAYFSSEDNQQIELSMRSDPAQSYRFDFSKSKLTPVKKPKMTVSDPSQSRDFASWRIAGNFPGSKFQVSGPGKFGSIVLDEDGQGAAECFCWIRHPKSPDKVDAIALGTSKQNGIFVYSLHEKDSSGRLKLLRYYRDHRDRLTSLACSKDGRYLASTSKDQTVKIWSLEGIERTREAATQPREIAWGASFRNENGTLVIDRLVENGIAAQRGMVAGEVLHGMTTDGSMIEKPSSGAEIMRAIESQPLWATYLIARKGKQSPILLVPGWQPLLTLFVGSNQDWAVWTPQGFYDASVQGDDLFGWIRNRGANQTPGFFRASHLRRELKQPKVMRQLLATGVLSEAFLKSKTPLPPDFLDPVSNLISHAPVVRITSPREGFRQARDRSEEVEIKVEVVFEDKDDFDEFDTKQIKTFVNQNFARLVAGQTMRDEALNTIRCTFKVKPHDPTAVVQVKLFDTTQPHVRHDDQVAIETAATRLSQLNVHLVGIGVSDYPKGIEDLAAEKDVSSVIEKIESMQQSSNYRLVNTIQLLGDQVTKESVGEIVGKLERVQPNDLLVVFVAGHAKVETGGFVFVPSTTEIQDISKEIPKEQRDKYCIQESDVRELANLNCRRLFIVDTCEAGRLGTDWTSSIQRWQNLNIAIWTAARAGERAREDRDGDIGRFTRALLLAVKGNADPDGGDGFVSLDEAHQYVANLFNQEYLEGAIEQSPSLHHCQTDGALLSFPLFRTPDDQGRKE